MKTVLGLVVLSAGLIGNLSAEKKEQVFGMKDFETITARQVTILKAFPDLQPKLQFFNGHVLVEIYEVKDEPKILFSLSPDVPEFFSARRNGEDVIKAFEEATVKRAFILATPDGPVDLLKRAEDMPMGWWIPLKRTDEFEIIGRIHSNKALTDLVIHYDPDRLWRGRMDLPEFKAESEGPFDAFEVSLESLVGRVTEVLADKEKCRVKLLRGWSPVDLRRWDEKLVKEDDLFPMTVSLDKKLSINEGPAKEELTLPFLRQRLDLYMAGARAAEVVPKIRFRVHEGCPDKVFREVLRLFAQEHLDHIYVEVIAKKDKK